MPWPSGSNWHPIGAESLPVAGDESRFGISRENAVFGFVPKTSEAPAGRDADLFDILVTTDVLAEGVIFQQARHIINFDLPWNPMRLVQRHGRIDRIGSPHKDVYLRCFFPDKRLDQLLELEARIRRKLAQAAASVGVEHEVIPGAATSDRVFAETRDEIEALRRKARIFSKQPERILRRIPERNIGRKSARAWRYTANRFSGCRAEPDPDFAVARSKDISFAPRSENAFSSRFVPFEEGKLIRETLGCLRLIACREDTPREMTEELAGGAYGAWEKARRDVFDEWTIATDPANLQPKVRPSLRTAADQLRKYPPPGINLQELDRLLETIEAPWGARIERILREAMQEKEGREASIALVEKIRLLGLLPFRPPEPLPPIELDEIRLVCWMAVDIIKSV